MPPYPPRPPARRRRRRLLFWDKETQISREKFQEQLQTRAHCWECVSAAQALRAMEGGREGWGPCVLGLLNSGEAPGTIPKVHVFQVCTETTLCVPSVTPRSTCLGTT